MASGGRYISDVVAVTGAASAPGQPPPRRVLVANDDGGVLVLDVDDPEHPVVVDTLETPGYASKVAVDGHRVVVADGEGGLFGASLRPCLLRPVGAGGASTQ